VDQQTLAAYDRDAAAFARDWHEQPAPTDLHDIVKRFFVAGGATADIGCGSGREVAWLNVNGFPAKGFDASDGLLKRAGAIRSSNSRMLNCPLSAASPLMPSITCCAKP
jgi:trans-aconitate methyltransferase